MLTFYLSLIEDEEDKLTFEYIYYNHYKEMLCAVKKILPVHEDAEDAVQEALIRIAKKIKLIPTDTREGQRAYVLTIAKNVALSMQKEGHTSPDHLDITEFHFPAHADPFDELVNSGDYETLMHVFRGIPVLYREVLVLRYVFDIPVPGIAEALGRKASTVKRQISRAKCLLAEAHCKEAH